MKNIIALLLLFNINCYVSAEDSVVGIGYLNKTFSLVHESASTFSASLTTIMCGFPLKILKKENLKDGWLYVHAGDSKGYIQESFVSDSQGFCFQERYQKFFSALNLSLTDFYYWGKIQDQYESFETKNR